MLFCLGFASEIFYTFHRLQINFYIEISVIVCVFM